MTIDKKKKNINIVRATKVVGSLSKKRNTNIFSAVEYVKFTRNATVAVAFWVYSIEKQPLEVLYPNPKQGLALSKKYIE